jgi:hypothetical protein
MALAGRWEAAGWARAVEGVLRLTAEGWLLLDRLAVEMAEAASDPTSTDPRPKTGLAGESAFSAPSASSA